MRVQNRMHGVLGNSKAHYNSEGKSTQMKITQYANPAPCRSVHSVNHHKDKSNCTKTRQPGELLVPPTSLSKNPNAAQQLLFIGRKGIIKKLRNRQRKQDMMILYHSTSFPSKTTLCATPGAPSSLPRLNQPIQLPRLLCFLSFFPSSP